MLRKEQKVIKLSGSTIRMNPPLSVSSDGLNMVLSKPLKGIIASKKECQHRPQIELESLHSSCRGFFTRVS